MRTGDGRSWTYCHLSYLEPSVQPGALLAAGAPVGLVGSTGHSTGPHLHLQLQPTTSYPQAEAWFQGFAGRAFTWQDAPTPTLSTAPVFTVVEDGPVAGDVITFTLRS
jgi:murein DD-endopeptidase MepM/ murein hydrolase activator NlpD